MFFLSSSTICAIFVYFSLVTSVGRTLQLNKMYFFFVTIGARTTAGENSAANALSDAK